MSAPANSKIRAQVKEIQAAIDSTRTERAQAVKDRDAAKERFASSGLDPQAAVESDLYADVEAGVAKVGELGDRIADLQATQNKLLGLLAEDQGSYQPEASAGRGYGFDVTNMLRDPGGAFQGFLASGAAGSKARFGSVVIGELGDPRSTADMLTNPRAAMQAAAIGSDNKTGAIPADRRGIVSPQLRRLRLLDLFTAGTTESNIVEYVQILTVPNQAAETAQGTAAPEATMTTADAQAPARTIPVYMKVKRNALADVGQLEVVIRNLLTQDVRRRVEDQMVSGNGTGENLRGFLHTTGVAQESYVTGDNAADSILRACTAVYLANGEPDFTALYPTAWQDLLLIREDQANRTGQYLYGSPVMVAAPTIWGTTVVNNQATPANTPLVGDSTGANPMVREALTVRVSDSDQDDFLKGLVTILVEVRVAFPVWRPTSFAFAELS